MGETNNEKRILVNGATQFGWLQNQNFLETVWKQLL